MKIATSFTQAICCLTHLAEIESGSAVSGHALAKRYGLSSSYLLKHLRSLTAAGILQAQSGPGGGYRLARPANAITLLDGFVAIEGLAATIRNDDDEPAENSATTELLVIQEALLRADRAFREALAATTIFAVLQEKKRLRLRSAANGRTPH